ncbi:DoxX family protein [Flavobacterium sp. MMLR14_040]|uniref:DoxX family protein n=1 Tax=Flavobacterium sp. MMLR14_040 TaxID=3093843 RepID=UPI00298F9403|nr:DoxX family protein [Flavobacterium sp. MMLR14_040]MDW8849390.1 DoxX family protein [Flavobacterium sp. MMLR14_040]
MKRKKIIWFLRIVASSILLQTLFFKFSGAEESVYIFSKLGMEPYGRIGSGIVELIAATLILIPKTTWMGALLACGIMTGAILSHLFILGIAVENDGGLLFVLALIVLLSCIELINLSRNNFFNPLKTK